MQPLNLPKYEFNIRKYEGKVEIFDSVRKKYIALLPEEWVRQHVIMYLTQDLRYPKSLVKVESALSYHRLNKRSDILVFNRHGQCHLLVECKSFKVKINQSALDQITVYNKELQAKYLLLTNGINHYCCEWVGNKYQFINDVPAYEPLNNT